jgi:CRP/FNR family transcriptional regulator
MEILSEFSKRLDAQERQTAAIATEKVETRIALYLLSLMEENQKDTVTLPMMKKDLASLLGTTPETISRKFLEFEEKGLMASLPQNRIRILQKEALKNL